MKTILLQITRNSLYLTLVQKEHKYIFDMPQCFELPQNMINGKEFDDIFEFAKFVCECVKISNYDTRKIIFCIENDTIIKKEFQHLPCKKKNLLAFARLEAETVLKDNINDYMILNYEYGRTNTITGKLTSTLFAIKTKLIDEITKNFLKCGLEVIKIVPSISGVLNQSKTIIDSHGKTSAFLELGFESTHLVIMSNEHIVFQRTLETVYDDIIAVLMKSKSLSFLDAHKLVDTYGFYGDEDVKQDLESTKLISMLLETSINEIIRNIRMVLSSERLELNSIVICGRLSKVKGFLGLFNDFELDIPIEILDVDNALLNLPQISNNAKEGGYYPSDFLSANGICTSKNTEVIDFLNIIRAKSDTRALILGIFALLTSLMICFMIINPVIYVSKLNQQNADKVTLDNVNYLVVKELLLQAQTLNTSLKNLETDNKLLPIGKSNTEETVKQIFNDFNLKVETITNFELDNSTGIVTILFKTKSYNDLLQVKHNIETNDYFYIAIPFTSEKSEDIYTCNFAVRAKNFVPIKANVEGGELK
ncbi:MAG: hypothetical protein WAX04_05020 [Oscillospiraceae bacterium]